MIAGAVVSALIAVVVAATMSAQEKPAVSFTFARTIASAGDRVQVRAHGFSERRAVRVYLVRADSKASVRSALDRRIAYVGTLRPRGRSAATMFTVPPLVSGVYTVWCAACGSYRSATITVTMPPATGSSCPVTTADGRYGHDLLWTTLLPGGVLARRPDPDGSISSKFGWIPSQRLSGDLTVAGRRLDAPSAPMRVLGVNWGYSSTGRGSWATAVVFPAAGCWKLTARMRVPSGRFAVDLSYVLKVVRA